MDTITLATFNEASRALPLKQQLEESGIPAEIHDESVMERLWFVARPLAGVKVTVHARDYEKALALLSVWDTPGGPLAGAVRCPECHSSRVEFPQFTRKFLLPNLIGLLAAVGLVEKKFYCQDCHCIWPREGFSHSKVRPHMAPNYFLEGIAQPDAHSAPKSAGQ